MSILPTWPIAAATLVAGLVVGAGADHLWMNGKVEKRDAQIVKLNADHAEQLRLREVKRAKDEAKARTTEQEMAESFGRQLQVKEDEKNRIANQLGVAVASLQDRPNRQPARTGPAAAAAPDCKGTTGAELSRQDGEFLVGEAARANLLRAALGQCYAQYDSARALINGQDTAQ